MIIRLKYEKTRSGQFLSHLDLLRTLERLFRRAGLPLLFSEGFNPHPLISFGPALPVGTTSEDEYADIVLRDRERTEEIKERLRDAAPPALKILEVKEIAGRTTSLTALINMARYRVKTPLLKPAVQEDADSVTRRLMEQPAIYIQRRGKNGEKLVNIREGIYALQAFINNNILVLEMDIRVGGEGNVRPVEILEWVKDNSPLVLSENVRIHRVGCYIWREGKVYLPLDEC